MSQFSLPNGCIKISLENVVEILDSQRKPVNNSERKKRIEGKSNNELFPYFGATGEVGKIDDYIFDDELVALGEDGVPFLENQKRKAYIIRGKTWVNNHAHVLKPIPWLTENRYLCYFLNQFDYKDYVNGGTRLKLTQANMRKIPFNMVPLAEQKTISDKLDDLLARVESIKTRLENIPEILKKFRQSVLSVGLSGGFSNANDRVLHSLCNKWQWPELPSNWKVSKYSELVDSRLGKMLDKVKNSGSPTHYLGNINVRWFDFDLTNIQRIMVSDKERIELSLEYGDVLICEGGEPGRCAVWSQGDLRNIIFQKALHRARVKNEIIPEWLIYNLKNDSDNLSLSQLFTGTTIKHLTGKALANYPLRVPPVKEQKEIVEYIKKLFTYADSIRYMSEKSLLRINNLTQSILAKAFRGELTAQWREENPELISGLNSAEALLEKITAEKLVAGTVKKLVKKSSH